MKPGDLVKFVSAPPRWKGENPREPEDSLVDKVGIITGYAGDDSHQWGGIWNMLVEGNRIQYYGDFLEVVGS